MSRHAVKHDYIDGEKLEKPIYWCGREGSRTSWHFLDAQHLALSVGGSIQPCKQCVKAIIKQLSKELDK